jgi:predicted ATPase
VRGQDPRRAGHYLHQAAEKALHRSAPVEAITHLTRGLELLTTMPETPERLQHELDLQVLLAGAWQQTRGWAASEVGQAYARAHALCQRLGESPQFPVVVLGQVFWGMQRSAWQRAHELGEHLLTLAQRQSDAGLLLAAHAALGGTLFFRGEVATAHVHVAQASTLYVSTHHRALVAYHGYDLGVFARCYVALSLWLLGAPAQALTQMHEARTLAQELADPLSLALALLHVTRLHQWRREVSATLTWGEAVMALCTEHGFGQYTAIGRLLHGWALMAQGQGDAGLRQLRHSLTAYEATEATTWRPYYLAMLAEGYGKSGAAAEGLRVLAEALDTVQHTGEHWWEAELYRLRGELLWTTQGGRRGTPPPSCDAWRVAAVEPSMMIEAEASFRRALDIACHQQARALELRAATSLARLWQQQGKRAAAHQRLAEVYGWFTEGFDTADLQEAEALLEELAE